MSRTFECSAENDPNLHPLVDNSGRDLKNMPGKSYGEAHVLVSWGRRPIRPGGRNTVAPLKATNGTRDHRLSPFFPNPDTYVSGNFTISPKGGCGVDLVNSRSTVIQ